MSWVHATLLNFEDELDVRINVQTSELEDQNKELFKFVFPDGQVVGNIVQEDVHGRLTITNVLSEEVMFLYEINSTLKAFSDKKKLFETNGYSSYFFAILDEIRLKI